MKTSSKEASAPPPKWWSQTVHQRVRDSANLVWVDLCLDLQAFENRKPPSKRVVEEVLIGKMIGVGKLLRALFEDQITDPAELRRRGREYLGLPQRMPKRLTDASIGAVKTGPAKGKVNMLAEMLPKYYAARGWDADGQLKPETRSRLGL